MVEEHTCEAKKLQNEKLNLKMLVGQEEWEPRVLSRFCCVHPIRSIWPIRMCSCLSGIGRRTQRSWCCVSGCKA